MRGRGIAEFEAEGLPHSGRNMGPPLGSDEENTAYNISI